MDVNFTNKRDVQYVADKGIMKLLELLDDDDECYVPNYPDVYLMNKKLIDDDNVGEDEDDQFHVKENRLYLMLQFKCYDAKFWNGGEYALGVDIALSNKYLVGHTNDGYISVLLYEIPSDISIEFFEVYYNPITTIEEMNIMLELLAKTWIAKTELSF